MLQQLCYINRWLGSFYNAAGTAGVIINRKLTLTTPRRQGNRSKFTSSTPHCLLTPRHQFRDKRAAKKGVTVGRKNRELLQIQRRSFSLSFYLHFPKMFQHNSPTGWSVNFLQSIFHKLSTFHSLLLRKNTSRRLPKQTAKFFYGRKNDNYNLRASANEI